MVSEHGLSKWFGTNLLFLTIQISTKPSWCQNQFNLSVPTHFPNVLPKWRVIPSICGGWTCFKVRLIHWESEEFSNNCETFQQRIQQFFHSCIGMICFGTLYFFFNWMNRWLGGRPPSSRVHSKWIVYAPYKYFILLAPLWLAYQNPQCQIGKPFINIKNIFCLQQTLAIFWSWVVRFGCSPQMNINRNFLSMVWVLIESDADNHHHQTWC